MMAARRAQTGFTLIEVLLAVGMTASIAFVSFAALDAMGRSRVAYEEKAAELGQVQRFFNQMAADVRQAAAVSNRGIDGEPEAAFEVSDRSDTLLVVNRRGWHNPLRSTRSELQRVFYRYDGTDVSRGYWEAFDRVENTQSRERVVLTGVTGLTIRVLPARQTSDLERSWVAAWPPGVQAEGLPAALEVTLELESLGTIRRIYELLPQG